MNSLRKPVRKVSRMFSNPQHDAFLLYNGAPDPHDDPADYVNVRVIRGGRIGGYAV